LNFICLCQALFASTFLFSARNNTHWYGKSALALLVGRHEGHPAYKKNGGVVEVGTG